MEPCGQPIDCKGQSQVFSGVLPTQLLEICYCEFKAMFARKISIEYEESGERKPCPIKWLDNFSMRNFTNATTFDDTLPIADGRMEIGTNVPIAELSAAMEDWFRKKSYLSKGETLKVTEILPKAISR